ncbi:uncharacterized protein A4U43_C04F21060 [Asparagus officinalis]|uniref:Uncharacterized protein n=1 Tax=Asparagus officinalis TaxID=4686 RepID=A0A5P1F5A6_ASPOF|nr:uncharacterized protein A4U43_C04F21060 [Asparagus officinalis]
MDGAAPTSLPATCEFDPVVDFDGASGVLESNPAIDMILLLHRVNSAAKTAQHQKEELKLKSTELAKEWDLRVAELEAETARLAVVRTQATSIGTRDLRERDQKNTHEARDSRIAECIARIRSFTCVPFENLSN